jgi:hypothetical protein
MTHTYEDAETGITIEHEEKFVGDVVITRGAGKMIVPGEVFREFVLASFGHNVKAAINRAVNEAFGPNRPIVFEDLDELGDPESAEEILVHRDRERESAQ